MKRNIALKVVEPLPSFRKRLEVSEGRDGHSHSLHGIVPYQGQGSPDLYAGLIRKYSEKGDLVLDPFGGGGTTALEALLGGRQTVVCDLDPLALRVSQSKLAPADLTQVTLKLQTVSLRGPISQDSYQDYFSPFFDIDTFHELSHLKRFISHHRDESVVQFIEMLALGLLHGSSAGHFSAPSHPKLSFTPAEQDRFNIERRQLPEYRAVIPRLIKRAASVTRDGLPSVLQQRAKESVVRHADSRNMPFLSSGSVDLVLTEPPLPSSQIINSHTWLRRWFAGTEETEFLSSEIGNITSWLDFMNESLLELARVVKIGGRAIIGVQDISLLNNKVSLEDELVEMVEEDLDRFWEHEGTYMHTVSDEVLSNKMKARHGSRRATEAQFIVLRRR